MKSLIIASCVLLAACNTTTQDSISPSHVYEVETTGHNIKIYEFTPRNNKDISCILIKNRVEALECYPNG
jgi:hypothetical protein